MDPAPQFAAIASLVRDVLGADALGEVVALSTPLRPAGRRVAARGVRPRRDGGAEEREPDLAPLLTMVLQGDRAVFGPPAAMLLDPVPPEDLRRAIVEGIPGADDTWDAAAGADARATQAAMLRAIRRLEPAAPDPDEGA